MAPGSGAPLGHKLDGELWEPLQRLVFGFSTSPLGCRRQAEMLWKLCQWDRLPLGSPTAWLTQTDTAPSLQLQAKSRRGESETATPFNGPHRAGPGQGPSPTPASLQPSGLPPALGAR